MVYTLPGLGAAPQNSQLIFAFVIVTGSYIPSLCMVKISR